MVGMDEESTRDAARTLSGRGRGRGPRRRFQALRRDLEAGDTFVAGDRRRLDVAHGLEERDQLGAERLVMADRKMPHRIAAVRLEAETFGDLARQEIAH